MVSSGPGTVSAPGIYVPPADGTGGDNLIIRRNVFTGDLAANETNNDRNAIQIHTGDDLLIEHNEIDTPEHGIYILGANTAGNYAGEYTIRYNYIHDSRDDCLWISGPTATEAGSIVAYNICQNSLNDNGFQFQANGTDSYGTIVNNVIDTTYNAAIYFVFGCSNTTFKNNIVRNYGTSGTANEEAVKLFTGTTTYGAGSDFDNNIYYKAGDSTPFWENTLGSRTLAQWRGDMTAEAASLSADPLFVSTSDFRLQAGSPAINAGIDVGLTQDFTGRFLVGLPDIGAYEFGAPAVYHIGPPKSDDIRYYPPGSVPYRLGPN